MKAGKSPNWAGGTEDLLVQVSPLLPASLPLAWPAEGQLATGSIPQCPLKT